MCDCAIEKIHLTVFCINRIDANEKVEAMILFGQFSLIRNTDTKESVLYWLMQNKKQMFNSLQITTLRHWINFNQFEMWLNWVYILHQLRFNSQYRVYEWISNWIFVSDDEWFFLFCIRRYIRWKSSKQFLDLGKSTFDWNCCSQRWTFWQMANLTTKTTLIYSMKKTNPLNSKSNNFIIYSMLIAQPFIWKSVY